MGSGPVRADPAAQPGPVKRQRRLRRWLLATLLLAVALWLVRIPLLRGAGRYLNVSDHPQPVDCILVLGGGCNSRPFAAAALYKAGWSPRVLLTQVKPSPAVEDGIIPPEEAIARAVLLRRGVPATAITLLPGPCDSTFDEAERVAGFLAEHPEARVGIVTTDYHTRRARWIFRKVLKQYGDRIIVFGIPADGIDSENWWRTEAGLNAYVNEYVKFAFYVVRY